MNVRSLSSFIFIVIGGCQFIPGTDAYKIQDAKDTIARELNSPDTVQFRNVFVSFQSPLQICGEINGQNSFGAYSGFRRFMVMPAANLHQVEYAADVVASDEEQANALAANRSLFDKSWKSSCSR